MKLYPFSVQKHAHSIEFYYNHVKNTLYDMESGETAMEVKETEKSFIFHLAEFKSRYSGAHIETLFRNSKRVVIRKDKGGHAIQVWSDRDFTFYPYQAGIPYWFKRMEEA